MSNRYSYTDRKGINRYYYKERLSGKTLVRIYCPHCKERDPELFPDGMFTVNLVTVRRSLIPCACGERYKHTPEQARIIIERRLEGSDLKFIDFHTEYINSKSRLILSCNCHGEWDTTTYSNLINKPERGCPRCGDLKVRQKKRLSKNEIINNVNKVLNGSSVIIEDVLYYKNNFESRVGLCDTENMFCYIRSYSDILRGRYTKHYSRKPKLFSYILKSKNFFKFGITSDIKARFLKIQKSCTEEISLYKTFKFSNEFDAIYSEKLCKSSVQTCVVGKDILSDGYTETFREEDLSKVITILSEKSDIIH